MTPAGWVTMVCELLVSSPAPKGTHLLNRCPVARHDIPPKPPSRQGRVSLLGYARQFRKDILSAQPAHLYRARIAEMRAPFFRSYLCNDSHTPRPVAHLTVRAADGIYLRLTPRRHDIEKDTRP